MGEWTLFSNHGHVLVCLARDNEARLRSVADAVGITERAVQKIVRELQQAGFIEITKHGRCNRYAINTRRNLRHSLESRCSVGHLLKLFAESDKVPAKRRVKAADAAKTAKSPQSAPIERPASGEAGADTPKAIRTVEAGTAKTVRKKEDKAKHSEKPADDRQQGSLF